MNALKAFGLTCVLEVIIFTSVSGQEAIPRIVVEFKEPEGLYIGPSPSSSPKLPSFSGGPTFPAIPSAYSTASPVTSIGITTPAPLSRSLPSVLAPQSQWQSSRQLFAEDQKANNVLPPSVSPDPKAEEANLRNLRKAHEAVESVKSTLKWLSKALRAGAILVKNSELEEISKIADDLHKPASEFGRLTEKLVGLAEIQSDRMPAEDEEEFETLLDMIKLVQISKQKEVLDRFARKVRNLRIGLVSEHVDDKMVVSADLLVENPKRAEARFKVYLTAMRTNAEYLKRKCEQLEEAGNAAKGRGRFCAHVQLGIEKAILFSGEGVTKLIELYLSVDDLGKAYSGLAADCLAKAKEAKQAAEVEQRRHDDLRETLRTSLGFRL